MKVPAAHNVQSGAGWPPGLYDPVLQTPHSDAVLAPGLGLCVPAGQGVESQEPAGQKQPGAQGIGGDDDAGGQNQPGGQDWQPPAPLMKKPERQPERKMTTVEGPELVSPPPKRARFETDVAARKYRATLRDAVVHNPEVTLKISTTLETPEPPEFSPPPPKRARFETDVAAR